MTAARTLALALFAPLLLAGCGALGALSEASKPLDAYQLSASPAGVVARGRAQPVDVTVEIPTASAAIDTEGILIRPRPTQVQYLAEARWIEPAPLMLQSALVDGIDRTGAFRYVGRRPLGPSGDYALVSSISEFDAAILPDGEKALVNIRITARLVREDDARVVASEIFEASAIAPDTETPNVVAAYDTAATQVIDSLILWVLRTRGVRVAQR